MDDTSGQLRMRLRSARQVILSNLRGLSQWRRLCGRLMRERDEAREESNLHKASVSVREADIALWQDKYKVLEEKVSFLPPLSFSRPWIDSMRLP